MDGINQWIDRWKKNGWMTAAKKIVKNKDLWLVLDQLICPRQINWVWVKDMRGTKAMKELTIWLILQLMKIFK